MAFARGSSLDRPRARAVLFSTLLPVTLLLLSGTGKVQAQLLDRLAVTTSVGAAFPLGEVADYVLPGPSVGLQAMYELSPRFALGVESNFESHQGDPRTSYTIFTGPPFQTLRWGATAEAALLPPEAGSFTVIAGGGAGYATYFSERLYNPNEPPDGRLADEAGMVGGEGQTEFSSNPLQFSGSFFAVNGRLKLAYVYNSAMTLFVEGQYYRASVDEEKTVVFVQGPFPVARVDDTGKKLTFDVEGPLTTPTSMSSIGLRVGFRRSF